MAEILHNCSDFPLGVELATSWSYPDFDALLEAQVETFRSVPVTLHAPFVEICGAEGSDELQRMESQFEKAYRWYHLFGATSMVMHTHEKKVPPSERKWMQQRAEAVILQTAERAREEGIHLTVENVGYPLQGNALFTQDEFISLFQHLPEDVGALIDTGHAMANGWDIPELIRTAQFTSPDGIIRRMKWTRFCAAYVNTAPPPISSLNTHPACIYARSCSKGT